MKFRQAKKIMNAKVRKRKIDYWRGKYDLYCMWSETLDEKGIRDHRITKAISLIRKRGGK